MSLIGLKVSLKINFNKYNQCDHTTFASCCAYRQNSQTHKVHIQVGTLNSFYFISIIFSNKMSSKILFKWKLSFTDTLFHLKYNNIKVYIKKFYELL